MKKYILVLILFLYPGPILADQAADKAEFKKLYAQFNDLYANSEDIDPIIEVAEKLYKLAPKAYGKRSRNVAVVTYNLAKLYDEKGGRYNIGSEKKAVELYKDYFSIQEKLKVPKDETYLEQYTALVTAELNAYKRRSDDRYAKNAIIIASNLNMPTNKLADMNYLIALQQHQVGNLKTARLYFESAKDHYLDEFGKDHIKVARTLEWLAKIQNSVKNYQEAQNYYLRAIDSYKNMEPKDETLLRATYFSLAHLYMKMEQLDDAAKIGEIAEKIPNNTNTAPQLSLPFLHVAPKYPARASEKNMQGWALVQFDIDVDGKTLNVKAIDFSHKWFEKNSINAAKRYRYIPKTENGIRVAVKDVKVRIEFRLEL